MQYLAYKTQNILVESLQNLFVEEIENDGLKIYVAVPKKAISPYIKLGRIEFNRGMTMDRKNIDINFHISIIQEDKNNSFIMKILNKIELQLSYLLTGLKEDGVLIQNAILLECRLEELIDLQTWKGNCILRILSLYNSSSLSS